MNVCTSGLHWLWCLRETCIAVVKRLSHFRPSHFRGHPSAIRRSAFVGSPNGARWWEFPHARFYLSSMYFHRRCRGSLRRRQGNQESVPRILRPNENIALQDRTSRQDGRRNNHPSKRAFGDIYDSNMRQPYMSRTGHSSTAFGFNRESYLTCCAPNPHTRSSKHRSGVGGGTLGCTSFLVPYIIYFMEPWIETEKGS